MTLIDLGAIWNAKIDAKLAAAELAEAARHTPSGRLSAGMLGWPLQWQVLKVLGVPPLAPDAYLLRKFQRGKSVEAWLLDTLVPEAHQVPLTYRGVVGVLDAVMRLSTGERIPLEVKSVTNAKYRHLRTREEPDRQHRLQAALYAAALQSDQYAIVYVASDDLRVKVYVRQTAQDTLEVDRVINDFHHQYPGIPAFVPAEAWQAAPRFNLYQDWAALTAEECARKFE